MIPMVNLAALHRLIHEEVEAGMQEVMRSSQFLDGANVAGFENEAANYLQVRHAITCGSGTDALHLSLRALGVGEGDEVITTPFTFFATVEAILYTGAQVVFVDIDPQSWTLDINQLEAAITPRTRAIIPVHLFGNPAAMPGLMALAQRHGLPVVEDCAQSFGARIDGRMTGSWGATGCFSFFPSKNLGAYGDGGMITTDSDSLADQLRKLRNHGSQERYQHQVLGYNSRLDELQAVVLRTKLRRIEQDNEARRTVARRYRKAFAGIKGLAMPHEAVGSVHVYNQYTVQLPQRDAMFDYLQAREIGCAIHYPRALHQQPVLHDQFDGHSFPAAEHLARHCLSLPICSQVTDHQVDTVITAVQEALR
ncbi:erythromycin biosynthesis sensory transduction protein eryC1 [Kineobactrum sediminis]|uniref:Erythromycin biosynthesis sensory transduction protein eryC1 n=1 Tax=Kineobactrum sediminis TaxID=1905677 RepID=A0A2N5Y1I4_9GAMM|nr:DegT/DnrJ/EryC1/StrS family aminotransferase [Kineobactrum sediminis]PLW82261.1 erythromycin biosynthesis sensory transduction protein eryC1 [Kineobactrum sediminis]